MKTRISYKTPATLLCIAAAAVFACHNAQASSFASGVTNNNGTIQFYLNEVANNDGVYVLFDNGSVSNLLHGQTNVGLQTFPLSTHTNFAIYVTKTGSGSPFQISSDSNTNSVWGSPRGVATVYNPSLGYLFGRIYVDNSSTAGKGKGIFMMNSDQSGSATGFGPFTTGVWNASSSSPYRMYENDDGTLFVGDFSTAAATVWQFDPNLNKFTNQVLAIASETGGVSAGTHGDIVGEPVALGSVSKGNLVLFTADEGLPAGISPTNGSAPATLGYKTTSGTYNNVERYTIHGTPLPYTNGPDLTIGLGLGSIPELMTDVAIHKQTGNIYGMFDRANAAAPCLQVFDPTGATRLFTSLPDSQINNATPGDPLINAYVMSLSPDGLYCGIIAINNVIYVLNITNGVPDLSSLVTITNLSATGNARGLCWDAADNIYEVSSGQALLRIYSLGNSSTTVYKNDTTGTNGSFQLELPPISANILATTPLASQNYGTPISGVFTITLNTNVLTVPLAVNFTFGGTATNGTYISSATNTVTFPAGTSPSGNWSTNILITPTAAPVTGPVITVTCKLNGGSAYLAVPKLIDTVTIANTGPQSFSISPVPLQVPPITSVLGNSNSSIYRGIPNDYAPMFITRLGDTNGPGNGVAHSITLTNFVYGGTAVFGTDYTAGVQSGTSPVNGSGSVTFGPGDIVKQVIIGNPVPTPNGGPAVGEKSITVALGTGAPSLEGFTYSVTGGAANFVELDNAFTNEVVLYSNPLTNAADSTNWTLTFASTNLGATTVLPILYTNYNNASPGGNSYSTDNGGTNDFDVDFGYPIANDSIGQSEAMAANHWTTALKMTVNKDPNIAASAGVNVYPQGQKFYGNYALRFNMMLLESAFTGSVAAEFAEFGIDHYGTNCNWIGADVVAGRGSGTTNADGSWAAIASDQGGASGGTPADLALYDGAKALPNSGFVETVSAVENTFSNVYRHPPFTANGIGAGVGSPAELGGQPANQWVDVEMKQFQNTFTLSIDKSVVLTFANTNVFTNGTIMFGYDDPFANSGDIGAAYYSNVRVVEISPFVSNNPISLVLNPGAPANFSVGAIGVGPFTNQLYVSNGLAVGSPVKVSTPTDSASFSIPNVTTANATNYYVVVSDTAGSITSAVASITLVTAPPTITTNQDVTVSLSPVLTGPVPAGLTYVWSTNGVVLTNGAGRFGGTTTGTLVITNVQPSDSMVYTVVISNAVSSATTTAALSVIVPTPPTFTSIAYSQTNAVLQFTSTDIYDITNSFNLQSSTVVTGPYTNTPATITFSNGTFQIILPQTNATEFYRLMHK